MRFLSSLAPPLRQWLLPGLLTTLLMPLTGLAQPSVITRVPVRHSRTAAAGANVAVTFSQSINPATGPNLRVFSGQRGGRKGGAYNTSGATITLNPTTNFRAGEKISVTVPNSILSTPGNQPAVRQVYQFAVATTGGSGSFAVSSTQLSDEQNGMAMADIDNDGDLDLLATGDNSTVMIRRNNGNGTFGASASVAVGTIPSDIEPADIDGDGDLDLLVANEFDDKVSIRFNNGSGTFSGATNLIVGDRPTDVRAVDIDADGDLDMVVANYLDSNVQVYTNNGTGTFSLLTTVLSIGSPGGLELADFDSDGDLDMVTSNVFTSNLQVRFNNGSGVFGGGTQMPAEHPATVKTADIDGDGDIDLLAPLNGEDSLQIMFNNGAGVFSRGTSLLIEGGLAGQAEVGDVDGDGDIDLLLCQGALSRVAVFLNRGNGVFVQAYETDMGDPQPGSIAVGDLDGDGDLDMVTGSANEQEVAIGLNRSSYSVTSVSPAPHSVIAPRTGNMVVGFSASVNPTTIDQLVVFGNQRYGLKPAFRSAAGNQVTINPQVDLRAGEEIMVTVRRTVTSATGNLPAQPHAHHFTVAATGGLGTFLAAPNVPLGASPEEVKLADFNGDGDLDMVVSSLQDNVVMVRMGNGAGGFSGALNLPFTQCRDVVVADFNLDLDLDIVAVGPGGCTMWRNEGNGTFGPPIVLGGGVPILEGIDGTAADVDGDGLLDLLVSTQDGEVRVMTEILSPKTIDISRVAVPLNSRGIACSDVDDDGDLDLLVANTQNNTLSIHRNNGSGVFGAGTTVAVGTSPDHIATGDLDGDGDGDAVVGNTNSNTVSVLFNNGSGTFNVGATISTNASSPLYVKLADIDGDGDLDLLTNRSGARIWRNNGTGAFTLDAADPGALGQALAVGDLDNDGDLDFVATDLGGDQARVRLNQNAFLVTAVSPMHDAASAPRAGNVGVTFNQNVNNATANRIRVWGQQRGGKKAGVYSTNATKVTFNPATHFAPGELVSVTIPATVVSSGGQVARKRVFQFRAAATGGEATFTDVFHATNDGTFVESVTTADMNGDGNLDILESHQDNDEVMLHLGNGDGTFAAGTVVGTAQLSNSLATADLDNDGDLDLLVADRTANVVRVSLNNGSGTFGPATNVSVGSTPTVVTTGDVDGDGDLDFVAATGGGGSVRFNNGSGVFSGAGSAGLSGTQGVALGDLDSDGDLDAVSTSGSVAYVRFNNGSGQFGGGYSVSVSTVPANANASGVMLGDLDADGDLDLVVNNEGEEFTAIRLNDGLGQLSGSLNVPSGPNGYEAAMGDLDGDGDLDIVVANDGTAISTVLLNNGHASFTAGTPASTTTPLGITLGDVDNDGDLDLLNTDDDGSCVEVNLNTNSFTVTARAPERHTASAALGADVVLTLSENIKASTASQLRVVGSQRQGRKGGVFSGVGTTLTLEPNTDFVPGELVSVTARATIQNAAGTKSLRPHVYQFRAAATGGSGTFTSPAVPEVAVGTAPAGVALGDIDGDGDLDAVVPNQDSDNVSVLLNDGAANFTLAATLPTSSLPKDAELADIDADGDLDLVVVHYGAATASVWKNSGGVFGIPANPAIGSPSADVTLGDIDGDGDLDMLTVSQLDPVVNIRFNNGAGVFGGTASLATTASVRALVLGDVDRDGDLDLLASTDPLYNPDSNPKVEIYPNLGDGTFGAASVVVLAEAENALELADLDGDLDLDLLAGYSLSDGDDVVVRFNDGFGGFSGGFNTSMGSNVNEFKVADVDGDGDLDLLACSVDNSSVGLRLNNGSGAFGSLSKKTYGSAPYSLEVADLDGDGDLDLLTANFSSDNVSVRLNAPVAGPAPTITGFTPDHGVTGTVVTLTGTNFTGASAVTFDGVPAPGFVVDVDGLSLTVSSPPNTFNGVIAVTTPNGTVSTATDFGVDLVVAAAEVIPAGDFHHITVTATGIATLGGAVEATSEVLVQTGGELADGGQVLSGTGSFRLDPGATLRLRHPQGLSATGTLQLAGGLTLATDADYVYQGALAQVTGANLPGEVRNLTIDNATGVSLTQTTSVRQVLTMAGDGNFDLNGQALTLLSDAAGTALLVNAGAGQVMGDATAQCWLNPAFNAGLGYRHLASPAKTSTFADLTCDGFTPKINPAYNNSPNPSAVKPYPTVFGFDETLAPGSPTFELGYYSPTSLTDAMGVAQGYVVYLKGGLTPDFTGELNQGNVTRGNLTKTGNFIGNTQKSGWHLVGNPYPSPLDWDLVPVPAGLNPSISVFRSTAPNAGQYLTRANGLGNLPDGIVPLGQAFFARVDVAPVDLTFTNACRVTTYGSAAHYRPAADPRPVVKLALRVAGAPAAETDGTVVYFEGGATADVDRTFDGERPAHNIGLPTLVSLTADGAELAVNGLPETALTANTVVELLLDLPAAGTYELSSPTLANLAGTEVVLLDRLTQTRYELAQQPVMTFTTGQAGEVRGRFALLFNPAAIVTGQAAARALQASLTVYPNPAHGRVQVSVPAEVAAVELLDATGRVVLAARASAATTTLDLSGLVAGIYTVRAGALTQQLVVE